MDGRGGVDRLPGVAMDRRGEVVVLRCIIDQDKAHADCNDVRVPAQGGLNDQYGHVPGISLFHLSSISGVKNSDVFIGAYVGSDWNFLTVIGTATHQNSHSLLELHLS